MEGALAPVDVDEIVVAAVRHMVAEGFERRRAWLTALFFTKGTSAHKLFFHKDFHEASTKDKNAAEFRGFVRGGSTAWFTGSRDTRPKDRMLAHAKTSFDAWCDFSRPASELVRDALYLLTTPFAHDAKGGAEGGCKMFFLASPWQVLRTIPMNVPTLCVESISNIVWPGARSFDEKWLETGQPVRKFPSCCVYGSRSDETEPKEGSRQYFFTLDCDGINSISKEQEVGCKETRNQLCKEAKLLFTSTPGADDPGLLVRLTDILHTVFREVLGVNVAVSWHCTSGYKPSYRAYVVGMAFRDNYEAKAFVEDHLQERCGQMFLDHLPEPFRSSGRTNRIVDCGTYADGWDRCIGSAKLISKDPMSMRFLNVGPLAVATDSSLIDLFNVNPNRYLMTVLGWIYPEEIYKGTLSRDAFIIEREPTAGTRTQKAKKKAPSTGAESESKRIRLLEGGSVQLSVAQNRRLSSVIAQSMKKHGLVHPEVASNLWKGDNGTLEAREGKCQEFTMQAAASDFMICTYRNCNIQPEQAPQMTCAVYDPQTELHSSAKSGGKMNFHVSLRDYEDSWITQNCFKCGGAFGHKMQYICPVSLPVGAVSLKTHVMGEVDPLDIIADDEVAEYFIPNVMVVAGGVIKKLF